MPRSTREYLLRYADQAINDFDRALYKLKQLSDTYGEDYPEHQTAVTLIATQTLEIQEALQLFRSNVM